MRPGETKSPRKPPRTEATRTKRGSGAVSSSQTTRGGNKVGRGSSPTGTHPRPDAPREATVRASRNRNGTEQAVALISERPGHRLSRVFRRPPWRSELPPGGAQCAAAGPTPARADTPDANSLAHGERRRARRPRPTSTSPLAVPEPTKRQAQSSDRGTNPRGPPAQICRLSPVTGHRCVASGLGAVPRRKERVPPPAQTCLPMSVSARRMRHKYGTGKAGASLHFLVSAQRPCVGRQ